MSSGLKVESSNSPKFQIEDKINKTVTFDEPLKPKHDDKKLSKLDVKLKGENKNPRKPHHFSRHDINKFSDFSFQKSGKRRYSLGSANEAKLKRRRQNNKDEKIILPTKFLLGGNINDPLNLGSLQDEEVNRRLNAVTPESSPYPTPKHHLQVEVLIPPNIRDPLNLNNDSQDLELSLLSPNKLGKRKKNKRSRQKSNDESPIKLQRLSGELVNSEEKKEIETLSNVEPKIPSKPEKFHLNLKQKVEEVVDKIVSPVIPQGQIMKGRKKLSSFSRNLPRESSDANKVDNHSKPKKKIFKKRHSSGTSNASTTSYFRPKDSAFKYGNYDRYYGYRNHKLESDPRLKCLKKDWIDGKDILDIGCNVGHLTLTIAKEFSPRKIIGLDIDRKLIQAAKKNVRHYIISQITKPDDPEDFPISLPICYGPLIASAIPQSSPNFEISSSIPQKFPYNVSFVEGDYVLENDDQMCSQKPEFDLILALSLTKWVHLNHGDAGLKRLFKRIFNQLRPGGRFVLESQAWPSYDKKKKLTEEIFENYKSIKFKPEEFTEYLLSKQVGFITCEVIDTPYNPSKGFRRPIQLFTKAEASPLQASDSS